MGESGVLSSQGKEGWLRQDGHTLEASLRTEGSDIFRKVGVSWAVIH